MTRTAAHSDGLDRGCGPGGDESGMCRLGSSPMRSQRARPWTRPTRPTSHKRVQKQARSMVGAATPPSAGQKSGCRQETYEETQVPLILPSVSSSPLLRSTTLHYDLCNGKVEPPYAETGGATRRLRRERRPSGAADRREHANFSSDRRCVRLHSDGRTTAGTSRARDAGQMCRLADRRPVAGPRHSRHSGQSRPSMSYSKVISGRVSRRSTDGMTAAKRRQLRRLGLRIR